MKSYLRSIDTKTSGNRNDVTPLFSRPADFNALVDDLIASLADATIDYVACIDALGFILGTAIAQKLKAGIIPIRKGGKLPVEVLKRYEKWKDVVRISGPEGLRLIRGFRDEALRGEWKGHRSSRLGLRYRVIYEVVAEEVLVLVIDITPHEYSKR